MERLIADERWTALFTDCSAKVFYSRFTMTASDIQPATESAKPSDAQTVIRPDGTTEGGNGGEASSPRPPSAPAAASGKAGSGAGAGIAAEATISGNQRSGTVLKEGTDAIKAGQGQGGKTWSLQHKLPKLPVPPLADSCRRYLRALEGLQVGLASKHACLPQQALIPIGTLASGPRGARPDAQGRRRLSRVGRGRKVASAPRGVRAGRGKLHRGVLVCVDRVPAMHAGPFCAAG